jgi:hypothetical protein
MFPPLSILIEFEKRLALNSGILGPRLGTRCRSCSCSIVWSHCPDWGNLFKFLFLKGRVNSDPQLIPTSVQSRTLVTHKNFSWYRDRKKFCLCRAIMSYVIYSSHGKFFNTLMYSDVENRYDTSVSKSRDSADTRAVSPNNLSPLLPSGLLSGALQPTETSTSRFLKLHLDTVPWSSHQSIVQFNRNCAAGTRVEPRIDGWYSWFRVSLTASPVGFTARYLVFWLDFTWWLKLA